MTRQARVFVNGIEAGILREFDNDRYEFTYKTDYQGAPVSLTMPITKRLYEYDKFPAFFEGLLPEGIMLEALLRTFKIDEKDYFEQLIRVGHDVVGAVTIEELK